MQFHVFGALAEFEDEFAGGVGGVDRRALSGEDLGCGA
jgi:hypothetical protein